MTFTWLVCIVVTAGVAVWVSGILSGSHHRVRNVVQVSILILAFVLVAAGIAGGLSYKT